MPKRRLMWRLFPSYVLVALAMALGIGWTALGLVERTFVDAARADLRAQAAFLSGQLEPDASDVDHFAKLARAYHQATGIRAALVLADGKVAFDSQERPQELADSRPEIQEALGGEVHDAVRYHSGLDQHVVHVALPIVREGATMGAVYLAMPLSAFDQGLSRMRTWFLAIGAIGLALAVPWAWYVSRGIAQPLSQIRQVAGRLAEGHWNARTTVAEPQELAELAEAFNRMAARLQDRIGLLIQNNNEQKAVFASMAEGVLAVDSQERVISLNLASSRLLGLEQTQIHGRRLREMVRNADLSRFITRALTCQEPVEADVLLHGERKRVMQARGSALHDLEGRTIGAVIVLNDVTDFRRLEDIRRDFVANVSHELKTPVTSIKGFVETLLDGAMTNPGDTERFLRIIAKQADRLHAIIEDLLSLSNIEQSEDAEDIVLEPAALRGVLEGALATCQAGAGEKNIEVTLQCDSKLSAQINPLLFEQAVLNLLDNAIKYSEPGRRVRLWTAEQDGEVTINVTDQGCGIASEHIARVFERFYRVDRARSRKLGGTGLGLAIVKHIVQAHHGCVTVDSTLGIGSTFTIHLPPA
jgi:two-component system, OmpR family, phosphate regulon sensor histidine kinase PhoR